METVVFPDVSIYEIKLNGEKLPVFIPWGSINCKLINLECNYDPQGFSVKFVAGK